MLRACGNLGSGSNHLVAELGDSPRRGGDRGYEQAAEIKRIENRQQRKRAETRQKQHFSTPVNHQEPQ